MEIRGFHKLWMEQIGCCIHALISSWCCLSNTPCQCESLCTALNVFTQHRHGYNQACRNTRTDMPGASSFTPLLPPMRANTNTQPTAFSCQENEIISHFRREWRSISVLIRIAHVSVRYKADLSVFLGGTLSGTMPQTQQL